MKKKMDILDELARQGIDRDPRKCIYKKYGKFCERWAIAGGTVCPKHGGNIGHVKKAAQQRLNDLLLRKVERLDEISEQSIHLPSALGATQSIINRVMGKVGDTPKQANTGPVVNIGIGFLNKDDPKPQVTVTQIPAPSVDVIEADFNSEDNDE